jgi:hypothetical protein
MKKSWSFWIGDLEVTCDLHFPRRWKIGWLFKEKEEGIITRWWINIGSFYLTMYDFPKTKSPAERSEA